MDQKFTEQCVDRFIAEQRKMSTSDQNGGYVIEKGIPMPTRTEHGSIIRILQSMEPGDSVLIALQNYSGWNSASKRTGIPIRSHNEGNGKVRIWRIEGTKPKAA